MTCPILLLSSSESKEQKNKMPVGEENETERGGEGRGGQEGLQGVVENVVWDREEIVTRALLREVYRGSELAE